MQGVTLFELYERKVNLYSKIAIFIGVGMLIYDILLMILAGILDCLSFITLGCIMLAGVLGMMNHGSRNQEIILF